MGHRGRLLEKKYNIGWVFSLGNKWFTTENSIELTKMGVGAY